MNWTVFRSTLQLRRTSLFWYSLGLALYGWTVVAFYPLIEESLDQVQAIESIFTEEIIAVFGGAGLDFSTLGGFLGVEYLSLMWVLIVCAAVITFAAGSLGGSVEDGTMELTLAQPVSRTQVVVGRYLALAVYAAALCIVTALTLYIPGLVHGVDVPLGGSLLVAASGWTLAMAVGGFAYLISALSSGSGRSISVSLGVLAMMWLADIMGNLSERADWLSDISLFAYWRPDRAIDAGTVPAETWLVFGVAALVSFIVAVWSFLGRDVA